MKQFKEKFLKRYSELTDIEKLKEYSLKKRRKSLRVNTLKISVGELKERLSSYSLEQIKWCKEGFFIKGEAMGNLLDHSLGYFYIQDAASMIPAQVLEPKDEVILDMCASPGSKTTQLSMLMENKGMIIANDNKFSRLNSLAINLQRCGCSNTILNLMQGRLFKGDYDKILLDAPCSGTGIIRKSLETIEMYNPNAVRKCAGIQRQLILTAIDSLKEKGTLVYSTCSLEPEENEEVIDFLIKNRGVKVEKIDIDIKRGKPIEMFEEKIYDKQVRNCLRIWPQDNDTEGFFVAKVSKCS